MDEARGYLKQAHDKSEAAKPNLTSDGGIALPDWIEFNVLLREAESLLKSDTSKPESQTPMPDS